MIRTAFASYIDERICRAPADEGAATGASAADAGKGAPGGGGVDPAAAAAAAAAASSSAGDWSAKLDDGAKALVTTRGWAGKPIDEVLPSVFKSYTELEGLVGNSVKLPGKDAKPEEVDAFYGKLGRPEAADKYVLPKPATGDYSDQDKAFHAAMLPAAFKAGLSQKQIDAVAPVLNEWTAKAAADFNAARDARAEKAPQETEAALTKEWGGPEKFKENLDLGNRFTRQVFGDQVESWKQLRLEDGTYLGDNLLVNKMFAAAGRILSEEGTLIKGDVGEIGGQGATQAAKELEQIYAAAAIDPKHAYNDPKNKEHAAMQDKVMRLTQLVAGAQS